MGNDNDGVSEFSNPRINLKFGMHNYVGDFASYAKCHKLQPGVASQQHGEMYILHACTFYFIFYNLYFLCASTEKSSKLFLGHNGLKCSTTNNLGSYRQFD